MENLRLELMGLAKPSETRGLMGTGRGFARQESAGRVFGRVRNRTDLFLWSKPGPLACYPDPLLTLFKPRNLYNIHYTKYSRLNTKLFPRLSQDSTSYLVPLERAHHSAPSVQSRSSLNSSMGNNPVAMYQ